ncbi:hypothetical protein [Sphingomonas taxi]|uniref:hypothetical protein n=1 Tax=Sphingomonas taxi TaxID=1549858 RepID=UPI0006919DDD|nr:hypothetical protein [Sphingomonas taxi]
MHEWHNIRLTAGQHSGPGDGLCLMEAVALFAGERHGDWPACVCPVLIEFGRVLNDVMPDRWRTDLLLPLVPVLVGTRDTQSDSCGITSTGLERKRAAALLAWCVNVVEREAGGGGGEAELRARGALADAAEALRFGQAQHAARHAAAGLAWAVKAAADRELAAALRVGKSPQAAAGSCGLKLWQAAVAAYRDAATRLPLTHG